MDAYIKARDLLKKIKSTSWKLRSFSGQHDEAGGVIEHRGKIVATTYGGLTSVSSATDWERYYATAEFVAAAPQLVRELCDEIERLRNE